MFDRIVEIKVLNAKKLIRDALLGSFKVKTYLHLHNTYLQCVYIHVRTCTCTCMHDCIRGSVMSGAAWQTGSIAADLTPLSVIRGTALSFS